MVGPLSAADTLKSPLKAPKRITVSTFHLNHPPSTRPLHITGLTF
jgi:hypothetical protein